jgi:hypothetical protein
VIVLVLFMATTTFLFSFLFGGPSVNPDTVFASGDTKSAIRE